MLPQFVHLNSFMDIRQRNNPRTVSMAPVTNTRHVFPLRCNPSEIIMSLGCDADVVKTSNMESRIIQVSVTFWHPFDSLPLACTAMGLPWFYLLMCSCKEAILRSQNG